MDGRDSKKNTKLKFDNLSSEDLIELLKIDIHADSIDELEPDYILKILEVLEERENNILKDEHLKADDALDSFRQNYLPYLDSADSLYDWDSSEINDISHSPENPNPSKADKKPRRIINIKRLGIVAAVFIVFSALFFNTTAVGVSFWQSIAQWGRSTFRFSESTIHEQINEGLIGLHETLADHGITERLAPTWIPDGFDLVYLDVIELPEQTLITTYFEDIERSLIIQINALDRQIGSTFERNDENIYIYNQNGIDHYIMSNMDIIVVVWMNQDYECFFSGDITIGDAKLMIDSIYGEVIKE